MTQELAAKPHPLFYAQVPLLLAYAPFTNLKRHPTSTHRAIDMEHMQEAVKKSAENGTFYFSEVHKLKKTEKEQAALDYHLLKMEAENPSERYVGFTTPPHVLAEQARTLYNGLRALDPKQSLSLKTLLNQGVYVGNADEVGLLVLASHFLE